MAYPVSANFRPYIAGSHKVVTAATVCDPSGNVLATLEILGGAVTIDIDRDVRRDAGSIELSDPNGTLTPLTASAMLSPLSGYELRLYRGVEYSDGSTELIPLGVFLWQSVDISDDGNGLSVSLGGLQDRSLRISAYRYVTPITVTSATAVETVITNIVQQAWPNVPIANGALVATGQTVNAQAYGVEGDSDAWQDARDLADRFGYRLFFDADGELTMSTIKTATDVASVATYGEGGELMITSLSKSWDITDTYNGVIAVGEGSGLIYPARGVAWDDDATSPTYYLGPFGQRPRYYSSPVLVTDDQAKAAASQQLSKTLGISEALQWSQLVDPSLDVDDAITVVRSSMGLSARYRIDRLTIPLSATDAMSATARTRRVTA